MALVSQKVISDIVKGVNTVTGVPIVKQHTSLQFEMMHALLRTNSSASDDGQLSQLIDELHFFTHDLLADEASKVLNNVVKIAICDDFKQGLPAQQLADDYDLSLTKVLAYLIDDGQLKAHQVVFFTHALQHNEIPLGRTDNAIVSLSAFRSMRDNSIKKASV
jgi:hypothetical protein